MMSMMANIESTATMVAWPDSEIMTYRVQSALKDNSLSRKQKQTKKQLNESHEFELFKETMNERYGERQNLLHKL